VARRVKTSVVSARHRLLPLAWFGLAALGCGAVACGGGPPADPPLPRLNGIVVFCVDTLRADALGSPDRGPGRLPSVALLAKEGVTFADATASAPWTGPAVASLLTGLTPARHGFGLGFDETATRRLSPSVNTLAELLQAHGWFTTAMTGGGWVSPEQGLGQGFDFFTSEFDLLEAPSLIQEWARRRPKDRPFFLFLHTFAPHDPYGDKSSYYRGGCREQPDVGAVADEILATFERREPIPPHLYAEAMRIRWADPCGRLSFERRLGPDHVRAILQHSLEWAQGEWRDQPGVGPDYADRLRAAYDDGLAYADRRIDEALRALRDTGISRSTAIVLCGDHGEAFGEGGHLHHGQSLHDALIHVPLVVVAPGRLPAGSLVRGGCGTVDVLPTLLDLARITVPEGLDGRSLLPLVRGETTGRPVISEAQRMPVQGRPAAGLASVRTPRAKWVLEYDLASGVVLDESVFDLVADPQETTPLPPSAVRAQGPTFCLAVGVEAQPAVCAQSSN
jgi:arylsulfatase A-like enzyme